MKKINTILFFLLFSFIGAGAFHIVGGEITYTYIGNNVYHIKVKVFRDCFAANAAQFDDTLHLGIFSNNNFISTSTILFPGSTLVNDPLVSPCIIPPEDVCVEMAVYEKDLTLPPISGGYDIVYQRCCRNISIVNIDFPNETGATYVTHINPNSNASLINNSAYFNTLPPIFLCINTPFNYDHSAVDIDGDSLRYSFCDPYSGATQMDPLPSIPSSPPYSPVSWLSSFNTLNQITANPALNINSQTGQITGTPTQFGQFVIGVKVREYRNSQLIGETRRDFQFNVLPCNNAIASIPAQETFCTGLNVNFSNNSFNSTDYKWDFGDPTTLADTSILPTTNYTYPIPGIYTIMLVAYNVSGNCVDTAFSTFSVSPLLAPTLTLPPKQCFDNNSYNYNLGGNIDATATYQWDFGSNSTPPFSNNSSPNNVHFSTDSTHQIQVVVSQYGCSDTLTDLQQMLQKPKAVIGDANRYCVGTQIDFENLSQNSNQYFWDFGISGITSDIAQTAEPSYVFPDTGIFNITLIAFSSSGCSDTITNPFWVFPLFSPTIFPFNDSNYVNQCIDANHFDFHASGIFSSAATFNWNFGTNASISSSTAQDVFGVSYNAAGFFPITVTVQENGCIKGYTDSVRIYHRPQIGLDIVSVEQCLPARVRFHETCFAETPISYFWNFGDSLNSSEPNPVTIYQNSGSFTPSLTIITKTGCKDTLSLMSEQTFTFNPAPIANFGIDSSIISFFNPTIHISDSSLRSVDCKVYISDGTIHSECSFEKTFTDTGWFKLMQVVTGIDGCVDTMTKYVYVNPEFRIWLQDAFTPNGDGLNDIFLPFMLGVRSMSLMVYDRWGTKIFESNDKHIGWNGDYKNEHCQQGVYNYIFYYTDLLNRYDTQFGKIVLIR